MTRNNLFQRLKIGISKGWNTPTLPEHLLALHNSLPIRILRFIGGVYSLIFLSRNIEKLHPFFLYLGIIIMIIYITYSIFIFYYRIKHIVFILSSSEVEVRNSPLDKIATLTIKAILCAKGICEITAPIGGLLGGMSAADALLEHKGRPAIFLPFIANIIIPDTEESLISKERKQIFKELNNLDNKYSSLNNEKEYLDKFKSSGYLSPLDINSIENEFLSNNRLLQIEKEKLLDKLQANFRKSSN